MTGAFSHLNPTLLTICASASLLMEVQTSFGAQPLTTLQYSILGTQLRVSPAMVSVPKGIGGSILVEVVGGSSTNRQSNLEITRGAHVEATLRGPSFAARRLVGRVNEALLLPPLNLVGDYQIDDIKLVDSVTGAVRLDGAPNSVPVHVFDEVLVSRVTSRPLTLDEIKEKGIVIDELNFRAVEFQVLFTLRGRTFPVNFPVVAPAARNPTEIIPIAELEERLAEAERMNAQIAQTIALPPELEAARLNIQIKGVNFEDVGGLGFDDDPVGPPPITGILVIPGNIGFLNQFFSVQVYTENAAPFGSGLSVNNVQAELVLPLGPDRIASTNYASPGDDPLRFARIGASQTIQPVQPIVRPGADGRTGTSDDVLRLQSGESGQAEFLVEGLQEGLHVMDVKLTADLEGLAAGVVKVKGKAAGSVLVRNPAFSLAFSHPYTVRFGEPYDASITVMNTSDQIANLVSVSLSGNSISGAILQTNETFQLGNLAPGESATVTYRLRSQRTGYVSFSKLTTSAGLEGSLRLTMAVDERGVALSPDSIGMPQWTTNLPNNVIAAAQRVLGQALSIATAGRLPANVTPLPSSVVTRRVLDLAEAGQRIRYGDQTNRTLVDLLLDWQGGRSFSAGFDEILRETDAGREFREAIMRSIEDSDANNSFARALARAADMAGRGEAWRIASASSSLIDVSMSAGTESAFLDRSTLDRAAGYPGARGHWLLAATDDGTVQWKITNSISSAELGLLVVRTNGMAEQLRWTISAPAAGAMYSYALASNSGELQVDSDADGVVDSTLTATGTSISENPPTVLNVFQDTTVLVDRPSPYCGGPYDNYGTVLAVVFSKPMRQEDVGLPAAFRLDNGNSANSVQMQPGGRVALLHLNQGIGTIINRTISIDGIRDVRGNPLITTTRPLTNSANQGVAILGRVLRVDGSPAERVPVTLTMYDLHQTVEGCVQVIIRTSQEFTDDDGHFSFDFVMAGLPYTISATDTTGLSDETSRDIIQALLDSRVGEFDRQRLREIAAQPNVRDGLLRAFNTENLSIAIAAAEGLDRAVFRDLLANPARFGTEVPVVLRFRGRGTVTGRVLAADGATPLGNAAVNLFPDVDSRELGRGLFSDRDGRFAFYGVPLGIYSIKVETGDGRQRAISGFFEMVGQTNHHDISVPNVNVPVAEVRGRVVERDGLTPHANARVFIGTKDGLQLKDVVAAVTANAEGFWQAPNVPAGERDVIAISSDGRRQGERLHFDVTEGQTNYVLLQLQGTTTVSGQVVYEDGAPVMNAVVAGGEALARTDANGFFTLRNVPTGHRTIDAGVEARFDRAGIARIGSEALDVLPGFDNIVVIRLPARGRLTGIVYDSSNPPRPIPRIRVSIPLGKGFLWVKADESGRYIFDNMALSDYIVSAPSPPVKDDPEAIAAQAIEAIRDAENRDQVLAAVGAAFTAFANVTEGRLNPAPFNPSGWGYTRTAILRDGQTVQADVVFLPSGTIAGRTINSQGASISASVSLRGLGPGPNGAPGIIPRGGTISDPTDGNFSFFNSALAGKFELNAVASFTPVGVHRESFISPDSPNSTNNVLQFPPAFETGGRLTGFVLNRDGTPAGEGVKVHISFAPDYTIQTDTNGFFDTEIKLPASSYTVIATNQFGLLGMTTASVLAGVTNRTTVTLLDKTAGLIVSVKLASGAPATNATVKVTQGSFPHDAYAGSTDANGQFILQNIYEGRYGIEARQVVGTTAVSGRSGLKIGTGEVASVEVRLAASGTIRGVFLASDRLTQVAFAQVAAGDLGFAATDQNGRFEFPGMPLGTHRLQAQNPVSGRLAIGVARLQTDGETNEVVLIERDLGKITGLVIASDQTNIVTGAEVMLMVNAPLSPTRTVTTGPDGRFSFPGTPAGTFTLSAHDSVSDLSATVTGVLPEQIISMQVNITLPPLAALPMLVLRPDGVTPASNATVRLKYSVSQVIRDEDTDDSGRAVFNNLLLATFKLTVRSLITAETNSLVETNISLATPGRLSELRIVLPGVGRVSGRVLASDATTPVAAAELRLHFRSPRFAGLAPITFTDSNGVFNFLNVPLGEYDLMASSLALAAHHTGTITNDGQHEQVDLVLSASGTVQGRLVRSDGSPPVAGVDVLITFQSQTSASGRASDITDGNGFFSVSRVPVGAFTMAAVVPQFNGIVLLKSALATNAQVLDLGDVRLDEANPTVVSVLPADTATEIPITNTVELLFSEALDTNSVNAGGIFLRSITNTVAATLQLLPDPTNGILRLARLRPLAPLQSETEYEVVVVNGERRNPIGALIGSGPTDLAGRPLLAPFISRFTTADNDPPFLTSQTPATNAIQIDPRAVIRLVYNEPLRPTNFTITLTGTNGAVGGRVDVGPDLKVLVFTPTNELKPNTTYTVTVNGVRDLAGNLALDHPLTYSFTTLDTLGPIIATLRIADGRAPVAFGHVEIEAVLATNEPGASVRFTADVNATGMVGIGSSTGALYRVPFALTESGSITFRAIATDRFGNDGPIAETNIVIVTNQPPTVQLVRLTPTSGPLLSGTNFSVQVSAADDFAITNVTVISLGALMTVTNLPNGSNRVLSFTIPETTRPGTSLQFQAQATDGLGLRSSVTTLDFTIADGTLPALEILSPTHNALLDPDVPLPVQVALSDNDTNLQLHIVLSGAVTATQVINVATSPGVLATNTFLLSLSNALPNGGFLGVDVRATDSADNMVEVFQFTRVQDRKPPRLIAIFPPPAAPPQTLWTRNVSFQFDEDLDFNTVTTNNIIVTNSAGATPPYFPFAGGPTISVGFNVPLQPGVTYTTTLLPGLTDQASHPWVNTNSAAVPPEGVAFSFTTAAILSVLPTNNTPVVPGQSIKASVEYEWQLSADSFRFVLNSNAPVTVPVSPFGNTSVVATLVLPTNATQAVLQISAGRFGEQSYQLPALMFDVRLRAADDDGDGLPNGYEVDHGLNPFLNDAALDPDSDGLTNFQEFQLGTDPQLADTDDDGLSDGAEVALGCTDPLNRDTDGDGLLDGSDPNPCGVTVGITFVVEPAITVTEGQSSNLVFTVDSATAPVAEVKFSTTNSPPSFAMISDLQFTNISTNGMASGRLVLTPLLDEAGTYTITLVATATNGASGSTNITVTVLDNPALLATRWINPGGGNWNAPTNWSDGLPGSNRVAVITLPGTYRVTLNTNATCAGLILGADSGTQTLSNSDRTLTLNGASVVRTNGVVDLNIPFFSSGGITGTGNLAIAGQLLWGGGAMTGTGRTIILPDAVVEMTNGNPASLSRPLDNGGTVNAAFVLSISNAVFKNLKGGTFNFAGGGSLRGIGGSAQFDNAGAFNKVGPFAANIDSFIAFHNSGTVRVEGDTFSILTLAGGGRISGKIDVQQDAELTFVNGFHFLPGSVLSGAGSVRYSGGTNIIETAVALTGTNILNSGTLLFNTNCNVELMEMTAGTLAGPGDLSARSFRWIGGIMSGSGHTVVPTGGVMEIPASFSGVVLQRSLDVAGKLFVSPAQVLATNASINILPGGIVDAANAPSFTGTNSAFNNMGTLNKTNTGSVSFGSGVLFNNDGAVNVLRGGINISGGGTNRSTMFLAAGAGATISGPFTLAAGSTLTGPGQITFSGFSTSVVVDTPLAVTGLVSVQSRVLFNVDQTFNTLSLVLGVLDGPGTITVTGTLTTDRGEMAGTGRTVIAPGGTFQPQSGFGFGSMTVGRTWDNAGTVNATVANWFVLMTNALINNLTGGVFNAAGRIDFGGFFGQSASNNSGIFNNAGTFTKTSTNSVLFNPGIAFNNSGTVTVAQGTLVLLADSTNAGVINLSGGTTLLLSNAMHSVAIGSSYLGSGTLRVKGSNQLALSTNINFGALQVSFEEASTIVGSHALANAAGGSITFSNPITVPGSVTIGGTLNLGDSNVTLTIQGTLTLEAGAVLNNPGTLIVGAFVNNGGTINGNPPVMMSGPGAAPIIIRDISVGTGATQERSFSASNNSRCEVNLRWKAGSGQLFAVETTTDLKTWIAQSASIEEFSPGEYRAIIETQRDPGRFYRVRWSATH